MGTIEFQKPAAPIAAPDGSLIVPELPPVPGVSETESLDVWGFRDTQFDINENDRVVIRGSRYELSGKELPRLLPWIRETLNIALDSKEVHRPSYPMAIPDSQLSAEFKSSIESFLSPTQIELDGQIRMRHGHGHTQEEMFAIKYGQLGRIPDLVLFPESDHQVPRLIETAKQHNVTFLGGWIATNASGMKKTRYGKSLDPRDVFGAGNQNLDNR